MKRMELGTKEFHTRMLIGENVVLRFPKEDLKISGVMVEYFERNDAIVLKNYNIHKKITNPENEERWEVVESGDLIIVKSWVEIACPKLSSNFVGDLGER
ncbi:MAG: hypothetical protein QXG39_00070 [Candidatus Aenigmatarchaeota archaeon]